MSENGEIYTAGKNFTLPPAQTAWTNLTSEHYIDIVIINCHQQLLNVMLEKKEKFSVLVHIPNA